MFGQTVVAPACGDKLERLLIDFGMVLLMFLLIFANVYQTPVEMC